MLRGGSYRIDGVLGQGGFGITYLATDMSLEKRVAIKEFFPRDYCDRDSSTSHVTLGTRSSSEFVGRLKSKFLKEAKNIAKFDHPNIIRIHAAFEENNTAYYVMDYIKGDTLSSLVRREGALPVDVALGYVSQVGQALDYVHSFQMNHLDVKPANIMLRSGDNIPILIDFGLSKQYDSKGHQTSTTPVGISHGYAPLEQYNDGGVCEFSPSTDVYSLAATLYFLLSGVTPPPATTLIEDSLTFPPSIPQSLIGPLSKAMSTARKNRYPSVMQFLSALKYTSEGEETVMAESIKPRPDPAPAPDPMQEPKKDSSASEQPQKSVAEDSGTPDFRNVAATSEQPQTPLAEDHGTARSVKGSSSTRRPLMSTLKRPWLRVAVVVSIALIALVVWSPWKKADKADRITVTANGVSFKMIRVQGGMFTMGATAEQGDDAFDWEKPAHKVTLSSYYIGQTEVTQELWTAVMGSNPSEFKGNDSNLPVETVSWDDCQEFITKLNAATGRRFRLPTEAEWEYAARGGNKSKGYKYSGSNNLDDVAWYDDNSGSKTHAVAMKSPNELGIYDMIGNVWEWCQDWYGDYEKGAQNNPTGPSSGSDRVIRGGSWYYFARRCRSSYRHSGEPSNSGGDLGLRLVFSE